MTAISVVSMLWQGPRRTYGPEHVNRLHRAVSRHLPAEHEHVCIAARHTNVVDGIDKGLVRVVREPLELNGFERLGGCWRKLILLSRLMSAHLRGSRMLYLDLDTIICGDLTPLVTAPVDFAVAECVHRATPYNTSIIVSDVGARAGVWSTFMDDPEAALIETAASDMVGDDQVWLALRSPGERTFSGPDGVLNFRLQAKDRPLAPHARLVYFAGPYDPADPALQAKNPWIVEHWR